MDFELSKEQQEIAKSVRAFAAKEIVPYVGEWDEQETFPIEVMKAMGRLGWLGVIVPEEYGGSGLTYVDYVTIVVEIGRVCPSLALSLAAHNSLCTNHIFLHGSEAQRRKYLPGLASGERLGAWGLTEPQAGSDAANAKTTAVRDGGGWVLNGTKAFTTHGSTADIYVLFAVTSRDDSKRSMSALVVERGTPGLVPGKRENKLGWRSSDTSSVYLQDCRVPAENLIGKEGDGLKDALKVLDGGRISIAAVSLGTAVGAYDLALAYARERQQFGQPIAEFQGIQFMLAEMAVANESARLLTYRAAHLKDRGIEAPLASGMAKLTASEVAVKVADRSVQIHGGYGCIKEYRPEMFYRDAKLCTIGEGTSEIQRLVIARHLLRD